MLRKFTHEEILRQRAQNKFLPRNPISILLNDVRSLYNVGSFFRIADGIRAEKIYLCGITGCPPAEGEARLSHKKNEKRPSSAITKTALGAEQSVPWEYHKSALPLVRQLKSGGHQMVVMENAEQSVRYDEAGWNFPVCLVFGNEVSGVDQELTEEADAIVEIPMLGEKNSLNVAVAGGIVLYEALRNLIRQEQVILSVMPAGRQEAKNLRA